MFFTPAAPMTFHFQSQCIQCVRERLLKNTRIRKHKYQHVVYSELKTNNNCQKQKKKCSSSNPANQNVPKIKGFWIMVWPK